MTGQVQPPPIGLVAVGFSSLQGWETDDHAAALAVFLRSAGKVFRDRPAVDLALAKHWFEKNFQPMLLTEQARLTAYYEPELPASRVRTPKFTQPIYALPIGTLAKLSRSEIDKGALAGKGLEIAWIEHSVDDFLLQVQGCARLILPDHATMRIGFAGKNGHPYRSVGAEMVRLGLVAPDKVAARVIRDYVIAQPEAGQKLLQHNPSYVYFKEMHDLAPDQGPLGSLGVSLTANRSIAVDAKIVPPGLPVWVETCGAALSMQQLMTAQDTGGAITGAGRGDLFLGFGAQIGDVAGRVNQAGKMAVFWPLAVN